MNFCIMARESSLSRQICSRRKSPRAALVERTPSAYLQANKKTVLTFVLSPQLICR